MKPSDWRYNWLYINEGLSVYFRMRDEETSDGMARPYLETLAYMQRVGNQDDKEGNNSSKWRALVQAADEVQEINIPHSAYPMQIMDQIQRRFCPVPA